MTRRKARLDWCAALTAVSMGTASVGGGIASGLPALAQEQRGGSAETARVALDPDKRRLTVRAGDAALSELVGEISRVTGTPIKIEGRATDPVRVSFVAYSVRLALMSLLRGRSYVMTRSPDGALVVWLLSTGRPPSFEVSLGDGPSDTDKPPSHPFDIDRELSAEIDVLTGKEDPLELLPYHHP